MASGCNYLSGVWCIQLPADVDVKVDWAEPLNEPSEEVMSKVKSIYVCNLPVDVNDDLIRSLFGEFGEIERIVLSKNLKSARRCATASHGPRA
jgi:hypothetical protein